MMIRYIWYKREKIAEIANVKLNPRECIIFKIPI